MYRALAGLQVLIRDGQAGDEVQIDVGGELDLASRDVLRTALDGALEAGLGDVEVELSELTFCDSTGLCLLLAAQRRLQAAGRTLRLVNPAPGMLRLLELSATRDLFELRTSSSLADGHRRNDADE
jgi:anti-sigma B factor antagonist